MTHEHPDEYDPTCASCRPRLVSTEGTEIPEAMQRRIDRIFDAAPLALRQAWYRVVVNHSEDPADIGAVLALSDGLQAATGVPVVTDPLVTVAALADNIVRMLQGSNIAFREGLAAVHMAGLVMARSLRDPADEKRAMDMARELFAKGAS